MFKININMIAKLIKMYKISSQFCLCLVLLGAKTSASAMMTKFLSCIYPEPALQWLSHWGRVMHICISKLTVIGSDNGLSPGWHQAIIWTNAAILLSGPLGTNLNVISREIHIFSFKKMILKMLSAKWLSFCFCLNVLRAYGPGRGRG